LKSWNRKFDLGKLQKNPIFNVKTDFEVAAQALILETQNFHDTYLRPPC